MVGDGAADGRVGGAKVGGELGMLQPGIDQDVQAGAEVGELQPSGLLVEVAAIDPEAAGEDWAARQACW